MSRLRYAIVLTLLSATLVASRMVENAPRATTPVSLDEIARSMGLWQTRTDLRLDNELAETVKPSAWLSRVYTRPPTGMVSLLIAYYEQQRAGEAIHSPKNCLPGSGWEPWDYGTVSIPLPGRRPAIVNRYAVQNGSRRMLVLYWYQGRDRIFASEYLGKLLLVWDGICRRNTSGALVRLTLPDTAHALTNGVSFASLLIPEIERQLDR